VIDDCVDDYWPDWDYIHAPDAGCILEVLNFPSAAGNPGLNAGHSSASCGIIEGFIGFDYICN